MPAYPFELHLENVAAAAEHANWSPAAGALPALYLSHGAPPLFEDAGWMAQLSAWARSMPKPMAVLIVSAHWEAAPLTLSTSDAHVTPVRPCHPRLRLRRAGTVGALSVNLG